MRCRATVLALLCGLCATAYSQSVTSSQPNPTRFPPYACDNLASHSPYRLESAYTFDGTQMCTTVHVVPCQVPNSPCCQADFGKLEINVGESSGHVPRGRGGALPLVVVVSMLGACCTTPPYLCAFIIPVLSGHP